MPAVFGGVYNTMRLSRLRQKRKDDINRQITDCPIINIKVFNLVFITALKYSCTVLLMTKV